MRSIKGAITMTLILALALNTVLVMAITHAIIVLLKVVYDELHSE